MYTDLSSEKANSNMTGLPPTFVPGFHDEAAVRKMRYNTLGNTGLQVSHIGFGGASLCTLYGNYQEEEAIAAVRESIKKGVNYIDTAACYGPRTSEELLGKALQGIPRQAYYIATKVARYVREASKNVDLTTRKNTNWGAVHEFNYSAEKTNWSIDHSLKLLGLDYVDIIQIHDIDFASNLDIVLNETLPTLELAVRAGKARYIGVTGYTVSVLKQAVENSKVKISTILSYSRDTLIDDTLQKFIPYFQSKGVGVVDAAGTAMALLINSGPLAWHPANDELKEICAAAAKYCKERGVELGRLAVHHSLSQPGSETHLVGMNNRELVQSNLDLVCNGISELEKQTLQEIKTKFLSKITLGHWEGKEQEDYHRAMKSGTQ